MPSAHENSLTKRCGFRTYFTFEGMTYISFWKISGKGAEERNFLGWFLSGFGTVLVGLFLIPDLFVAQLAAQSAAIGTTKEILLSGNDWKLGSFPTGVGEKLGAFVPGFDDHAFRPVEVPGEVQRQIGLRGMDLYYQSRTLSLINEKEWWYRKRFTVSQREAGLSRCYDLRSPKSFLKYAIGARKLLDKAVRLPYIFHI